MSCFHLGIIQDGPGRSIPGTSKDVWTERDDTGGAQSDPEEVKEFTRHERRRMTEKCT